MRYQHPVYPFAYDDTLHAIVGDSDRMPRLLQDVLKHDQRDFFIINNQDPHYAFLSIGPGR